MLYCYRPETKQWRTSSKLLTPRYSAASAVLGSQMVISGGQDKAKVLGTVEAADAERGWVSWPELPHARKYHSMAAVRRFAHNCCSTFIRGQLAIDQCVRHQSVMRSMFIAAMKTQTACCGILLSPTQSTAEIIKSWSIISFVDSGFAVQENLLLWGKTI